MTDIQVRPDPQRVDDERTVLMRAGYRLIAANPDRPFTLKELLDEARLSTRAFYRHFDTKDDLLIAIYRNDAARVAGELRQRVAGAASPVEAVTAWIEHWVMTVFDVRRARRSNVLISSQFAAVEGMRRAVTESQAPSIEVLERALREGHDAGVFPRTSPARDARALHSIAIDVLSAQIEGRLTMSPDQARGYLWSVAARLAGAAVVRARS